jgi:transcriptional regulator with XRE-family HTH domain
MDKKNRPKYRKHPVQIAFGKVLKKKRLLMGLSQEALAAKSQLHFTYISSVERGERNISLQNIHKIARALECPLASFFPD